jgi:hypothetical protein
VKFNGALVIREHKGKVFYEAKWRDATGRQVKRRVGEAWLERDATGAWRPRRGRLDGGCLDEKSAIVEMNRLITEHASLVAGPSARAAVSRGSRAPCLSRRQQPPSWRGSRTADGSLGPMTSCSAARSATTSTRRRYAAPRTLPACVPCDFMICGTRSARWSFARSTPQL